jgi:ribonuclease PH
MGMRVDGRKNGEIREVEITPGYVKYPEGSVLIAMGDTRVLCTATIQHGVPRWKESKGVAGGWVTAEYGMLPRSTQVRTPRENRGLKGRTQEIRRLIGRSLRAAVDLNALGPRTCIVDCDVLQADGGTRTAAITGGYVALALALKKAYHQGDLGQVALTSPVAAISVGLVEGVPMLDLCYTEDSSAGVDINVVMNAQGKYIEVQGTAEGSPFAKGDLDQMLELANRGIGELLTIQERTLAEEWA